MSLAVCEYVCRGVAHPGRPSKYKQDENQLETRKQKRTPNVPTSSATAWTKIRSPRVLCLGKQNK